jgi:hypothetical protein
MKLVPVLIVAPVREAKLHVRLEEFDDPAAITNPLRNILDEDLNNIQIYY